MVPETHEQNDLSGEILLADMDIADKAFARALTRIEEEEPSYFPLGYEEAAAEQPANKRNKSKDWDGSSGPSRRVVLQSDLYVCDFCHIGWTKASFLAHFDNDMNFVS